MSSDAGVLAPTLIAADPEVDSESDASQKLARPRSKWLSVAQLAMDARRDTALHGEALEDVSVEAEDLPPRPRTRADCAEVPRPCPYVSCRYHLYLDVNDETGALRLNFPTLEPADLQHSCALDVADEVDLSNLPTFADVGRKINVTRERIRMMLRLSLAQVMPSLRRLAISDPDLK